MMTIKQCIISGLIAQFADILGPSPRYYTSHSGSGTMANQDEYDDVVFHITKEDNVILKKN